MMSGQQWVCRTEDQRQNFIRQITDFPLPFQGQVREPASPKTLKQVRYAHSLCNALAAYKQVPPAVAKKDAKVAFGVITVCTSIITGDRTARLKSFADYTKSEMESFITMMMAYLDENQIPYTPSLP